jgi:ADP-ribosylglycohydrolase
LFGNFSSEQLLYKNGSFSGFSDFSPPMICALALLWGGGDFEKTLGIAVCAGFDTDCNGATTGCVIGMMAGAAKIPEKWKGPLNNKIKSGIDGFSLTEISELAERTLKMID